jgi:hypothetical protein
MTRGNEDTVIRTICKSVEPLRFFEEAVNLEHPVQCFLRPAQFLYNGFDFFSQGRCIFRFSSQVVQGMNKALMIPVINC